MRKIILSFLVMMMISWSASIFAADEKCEEACKKYLECVEETAKRKLKPDEVKKGRAGCMNTCRKKRRDTLACYEDNKKSCSDFGACISKHYKEK